MRCHFAGPFAAFALLCAATAPAQDSAVELFERKIRPALAANCYACHSSKQKAPMGGLVLDTKAGLRKGGASGSVIDAANPEQSRLLAAVRYTDPNLRMPPAGKLPDAIVEAFAQWIAASAPDPRPDEAAPAAAAPAGVDIEKGRRWWAFQPVRALAAPPVANTAWPQTKIDRFVLAELERNRIAPSPPADPATLIQRASLDLTGLRLSYQEVQAFAADPSGRAYRAAVERLLASPHYGERWGRYWLDVARYAEDNPTSEATNGPYPYAWRYRDWVIEAFNRDVPYDRFVTLQLAADHAPGATRDDLRALGYLGAAPTYHKDARLSRDVIETLASDDWDERVDAVSRGLLGLTVACARCHDHKFDPILAKDYYSLASVFASTQAVERPLDDVDPEVERRFLWIQQRLIHIDYLAKLLTGEPGTKPEEAAQKVVRFRAEIASLKEEMQLLAGDRYPALAEYVARFGVERKRTRRGFQPLELPFANAVYDAGLWVDGSDPDLTLMDVRPGTPRDLPIFLRGNVANHGEAAPRRFLTVLSKGDAGFHDGAGRLELAQRIFSDAAPLAARVFVNRVWAWHFGKPLAGTLSDFGTQGEKPTHPELLDDLAARFIANGWSIKWLHREIMLSAAYRQSSRPRADAEGADPINRWLWRMNPRRLDIESWRDCILDASGSLDRKLYGISADLDDDPEDKTPNLRRTIYARISRGRPHTLFKLYDFPDASQHSPARELTTTPLQQLFVMNSDFLEKQSEALAARAARDAAGEASQVKALYRYALARDPKADEIDLALTFVRQASWPQLAQALLATNEMIFWP
ncbi:MAG: PSD1 and planctomycete cytochrome C domain-containing protein [Bryobacteraceae bacterium]